MILSANFTSQGSGASKGAMTWARTAGGQSERSGQVGSGKGA